MNAQMALLGGVKGSLTDMTEASLGSVIPVTCKGKAGELTIGVSTGVIFNILEVKLDLVAASDKHRADANQSFSYSCNAEKLPRGPICGRH